MADGWCWPDFVTSWMVCGGLGLCLCGNKSRGTLAAVSGMVHIHPGYYGPD